MAITISFTVAAAQPRKKLFYRQIARLKTLKRRDMAAEDMIDPLASPVFSRLMTSFGCSTTQITLLSRRGSEQMAQISPSERLKQIVHCRTLVFTSSMAFASAIASSGVGLEDIEHEPLGRPRADAGQLAEFFEQFIQTFSICRIHCDFFNMGNRCAKAGQKRSNGRIVDNFFTLLLACFCAGRFCGRGGLSRPDSIHI